MGTGFSEAALAVFTTLAPMGAASFIALLFAFAIGKPDEQTAKRIDRWTVLPVVVLALGFAAAFFHLANPAHAFLVFAGIGTSPLSNEVIAGVAAAFGILQLGAVLLCAYATLGAPRQSGDPFKAARRAKSVKLLLSCGGTLCSLAACFVVRFTFYAMHMTIGV